jgi:hypothetical protein
MGSLHCISFILAFIILGVMAQQYDPVTNAILPWDKVSTDLLRNSSKKVFAHYFAPFPISIDNKNASSDYYTENYLSPFGEKSKFFYGGGFLRCRPSPRAPLNASQFKMLDLQTEVRRAIHFGAGNEIRFLI